MTEPDDEVEPPLEGVLTAEEVEDALRSGITFADLIRDFEEMIPPDEPLIRNGSGEPGA